MLIRSVTMTISKNQKMRFFLMSHGSFNPKIKFLCQKVCSVACVQTDRQTDTQTRNWLLCAPFQGFRSFSFNRPNNSDTWIYIFSNVLFIMTSAFSNTLLSWFIHRIQTFIEEDFFFGNDNHLVYFKPCNDMCSLCSFALKATEKCFVGEMIVKLKRA